MKVAEPTINEALDAFLAEQEERLAASTYRRYAEVIELLRHSLDGYAHQALSKRERAFWEERYDRDEDAGSFCNTFGPEKIPENLGEFLGYFMVRKVSAGKDFLRSTGTVIRKLAGWLEEQGWIDAEEAADARERGAEAGRDLPRAEELAEILWETSERQPPEAILEEWEDDLATIGRVERGSIWFRDFRSGEEVGPVEVPVRASELARAGWTISALLLGRTRRGWRILEMGNVYP